MDAPVTPPPRAPRLEDPARASAGSAGLPETPTMAQTPLSALRASGRLGPAVHVNDFDSQQLERLWPRGDGLKAVFLDYDGTLREFEERPELAVPTQEIHALLDLLGSREDLLVYIISGRDANFLKTHLGDHHNVKLVAEHERRIAGRFQVWGCQDSQGHRAQNAEEAWKEPLRLALKSLEANVPGSLVEEKASSLVWHHRGVADGAMGGVEPAAVAEALETIIRNDGLHGVKTRVGHKMVEVSCRQGTKGASVQRILEHHAAAGDGVKAVLVAGDDVSDEGMFEAAPPEALTIKVGCESTHAKLRVDEPCQLRAFLERWVA